MKILSSLIPREALSSLAGLPGGDVDLVHLVVVPDGEAPGEFLYGRVLGEVGGVLGDLGVVGAADGQVQDAGDAQGGQADGPGGGAVQVGEPPSCTKRSISRKGGR